MINLKIEHFRTINDFEYDFPKGVTVVFGLGGSGKSTILQAFSRALIGKVPVNRDLNCLVVGEYESGRKHYIRIRGDGFEIDTNLKTHLNVNGEKSEIAREWFKFIGFESPQSQAILETFTSKIFLTPFSPSLVEYKRTARSNFLLSLFGASFIPNAIRYGRDKMNELIREKKSLEDVLTVSLPDKNYGSIPDLEQQISACEKLIEGSEEPSSLSLLKRQLEHIDRDLKSLEDEHQQNVSRLKKLLAKENEETVLRKHKPRIDAVNERLIELAGFCKRYKLSRSRQAEVNASLNELKLRERDLNAKKRSLQEQLDSAQSYKCLACGTEAKLQVVDGLVSSFNYQNVLEESATVKNDLEELKVEIKKLTQYLEKTERLDEYEALAEQGKALKKELNTELSAVSKNIERLNKELEKSVKKYKKKSVSLNDRRSELAKKIITTERNIPVFEKLAKLKDDLKLAKEMQVLKARIDSAKSRMTALEPDIADLKFLVEKGFIEWRTSMILDKCAFFEKVVNDVLEEFDADGRCEFVPKINAAGDVTDVEVQQYNNERIAHFYSLNSQERELIKTAVAIAQSIAHPHPIDGLNLLMVDEVLAFLDPFHKETVANYLSKLDKHVIVTTNDKSILRFFNTDSIIRVEMGPDGSTKVVV